MLALLGVALAAPLDFAVGCWQADGAQETWLPAEGGQMVGVATTGPAGKGLVDTMRLALSGERWVFTARMGTDGETDFVQTEVGPGLLVVENAEHDFPQRLRYERVEDRLHVRVETLDGQRGFDLDYGACPPAWPPARPPESPRSLPCSTASEARSAALEEAANADQTDRSEQRHEGMFERDAQRLAMVRVAVARSQICSVDDAMNAGVVLQHSRVSADHELAYHFFAHACAAGTERACSWRRMAWDRFLVSSGRPQWFGTQWVARWVDGKPQGMCAVAVDPLATEVDRAAAGHYGLAEFVKRSEGPTGVAAETYAELVEKGGVCPPEAW